MDTEPIGRHFMRLTRYPHLPTPAQRQGVPQPPLQLPADPATPLIELPRAETLPLEAVNPRELIEARRSLREYAPAPLSLAELSYLLWCTQGVREIHGKHTFRTVPSAGARHAFETYVLANRVTDLAPGLYRFLALEHALQAAPNGGPGADTLAEACMGQRMVAESAATFCWVAVAERMTWRYTERGYRYLHLDAGHVCQNLYLAAESIGCGACAIAAFDDDAVNTLLGLDGEQRFVIYLAPVGKR